MLSENAYQQIVKARNLALTAEVVHNFQDWAASHGILDNAGAISAVELDGIIIVVASGDRGEKLVKLIEAAELADIERP